MGGMDQRWWAEVEQRQQWEEEQINELKEKHMSKQDTGIVNIRGKEYQTVALRVQTFRERHPTWSLVTEVMERDEKCVVVRASISDDTGRVLATGHAEEYRAASSINKTSALENAETSAIGRALAGLGIGGTEFASADEVAHAINGKPAAPRDYGEELIALREAAAMGMAALRDVFLSLPPEAATALEDHKNRLKSVAKQADEQKQAA